MGWQERNTRKAREALVDGLIAGMADRGQLIAGGFLAMLATTHKDVTDPAEIERLRTAYFGGAQHLWGSIMSFLDGGPEETPRDLRRMELVQHELDGWVREMRQKGLAPDDIVPPETDPQ